MILHASSDAKKKEVNHHPTSCPQNEKRNSTFTLNKAGIIQYFLCDSSSSSSPAMLI